MTVVLYSIAMDLQDKLAVLADAAKYDASCASSGGDKRDSLDGRGLGSTNGHGICHAFTPDGRYKLGGDIAGSFWHVIGLCRFEPGELDPYLPHLRVPDAAPLFALPGV